jgi:hypothetical protein
LYSPCFALSLQGRLNLQAAASLGYEDSLTIAAATLAGSTWYSPLLIA